ncbi:MAG: hypothetical protein GEV08_16965 [Acidimicrobiia bacterium]|nr:hypothetical protein [Acidimicrobiia bacterium]
MSQGHALSAVTVLDLTTGVAGAYAGKLLADLGARVVIVEPPGGSPLRHQPPTAEGAADGILFEHLSGAKESVVPEPGAGPSSPHSPRQLLAGLCRAADVVLLDGSSPWEASLPSPRPEHLVEVDVSPFGRSGPYAGWQASDLVVWAMGGYLALTGAPGREPLWLPGSQAQLHAGAHTAFAALAGLHERRRGGRGQHIEVSQLEATLAAHAWLASSWAACGVSLTRVENDLVRAADGWAYVMRIVPNDNLFVLIDRFDLLEEGLTADLGTWGENIPRIFEAVAEWAADHTVAEIVERGQALRIAVTPVLDPAGVRADPQLAARDWWEHDPDGRGHFPGQPFRLTASPSRRRGRAPRLGEHSAAVAAELAGPPTPRPRPTAAPRSEAPFAGLRVVEVTNNWAGPLCGRFLADLGADVVKVEWPAKPSTRALFWAGPAQDQQRQGFNRSMYFAEMNRNKRDVALDLSLPEGREVLRELVRSADVLIENNSARVMPNLGLDWPALRELNPGLVMVSMSGYGASGPRRDWLAYGSNIETTSGLTAVTGYPDGVLSRTTLFYADPVSGVHGAVAVLAALEHRRATGEGQWVDLSLDECGAAFCAEALLELEATGEVPGPRANRDARVAPQGVYPCAGEDFWVAVTARDDADWGELARAIGREDLARDPGLATLSGRAARHDELDAAIVAWTVGLEQYEVAHELQRRGVPAAPVLANWQVLSDPHLWHRGFYLPVEHPVTGVQPTSSWPWRLSRTPARIARPAPLFAEHNRELLAEAGLDDAAIAALYAAGATADAPVVD